MIIFILIWFTAFVYSVGVFFFAICPPLFLRNLFHLIQSIYCVFCAKRIELNWISNLLFDQFVHPLCVCCEFKFKFRSHFIEKFQMTNHENENNVCDRVIRHMQNTNTHTHKTASTFAIAIPQNTHTHTHICIQNKQHTNINLSIPKQTKKNYDTSSPNRTGSLTSRGSDESKSRRVFGSLLRRHTSFGAPDSSARVYTTTHSTVSTLSHDIHELK